jgi:uncharacterized Zn ribbon protein
MHSNLCGTEYNFKLLSDNYSIVKSAFISLLSNMKGYIQNQTIILQDSLPNTLQDGDEVEITIIPIKKTKYLFPTYKLDIKEEYLDPEKIYEQD